MAKPNRLTPGNLPDHITDWYIEKQSNMTWVQFVHYATFHMDEFGDKMTLARAARRAKCSRHTMQKWLDVFNLPKR